MSQATKDVMSKIQQVEKAIVSGGGHQKSQSDIQGSSSNAIQEIDEEVRDYDGSLMEQGSPRGDPEGSNQRKKKRRRRISNRKSKSKSPPPFDISINPKNITIGAPGKSLIDPNLKVRLQVAYMKGYFTKSKNSPRNSSLMAPSMINSGSGSLIRSRDLENEQAYGFSTGNGLP